MRGRWASAGLGAGIARHRADQGAQQEIESVNQANQIEQTPARMAPIIPDIIKFLKVPLLVTVRRNDKRLATD